jgi:hypothetical protein
MWRARWPAHQADSGTVTFMPLEQDARSGPKPVRRMRLDGPALGTCVLAALAAVACVVMGTKHSYQFVVLLLERGHIPDRNAELFAAFGWFAGAVLLGLATALLLRLMYKINGTAAAPADVVKEPRAWRGRHSDGSGRRR